MTTELSVYRSDREQLLARVRELEDQLAEAEVELTPIEYLEGCPMCGVETKDGTPINEKSPQYRLGHRRWSGWTYPKACQGWLRRLFCWRRRPHVHQHCTACGARWTVDAEGWRFG